MKTIRFKITTPDVELEVSDNTNAVYFVGRWDCDTEIFETVYLPPAQFILAVNTIPFLVGVIVGAVLVGLL